MASKERKSISRNHIIICKNTIILPKCINYEKNTEHVYMYEFAHRLAFTLDYTFRLEA